MSQFICNHCFIDYGDKQSFIEHTRKVVERKEKRAVKPTAKSQTDKSIDRVLYELANTAYQHGKATKTNTPFHYGEPVKETSAKIHSLLMDVIEIDPANRFNCEALRIEQRTKLNKLFNKEEK